MSEVETFFRYCPSCGRRFHIKLVSKKLVNSRRETFTQKRILKGSMPRSQYGPQMGNVMASPTIVEEDVPVTIDVEDFQYAYKCKHCGHEWTENRAETHKEG